MYVIEMIGEFDGYEIDPSDWAKEGRIYAEDGIEVKTKVSKDPKSFETDSAKYNSWQGECPNCKTVLGSNDMPYLTSCPYCDGRIPYEVEC